MQLIKRFVCVLLVLTMLFSAFAVTTLNASAIAPLPHRVQFDEPWGSVVVGYGNISGTGCGILSLVNAVGYLTGKEMDVIETAKWAYSVNGFNNIQGNLGTYRLVLYPKVQAKYGAEYGFTVDCNTDDNGWWAGASNQTLKNHLANGGVAIGNIPGHFIAIVDYNAETNMFHVLDSAPTADRGTMEKRGDVWLSESHMSTGNYKLGWFCLLSATGIPADEQDNEREFLGESIKAAEQLRFYNFNAETLSSFRTAYANAVAVYNSTSSASADYTAAKKTLDTAMLATSAISVGKSYTATPNARTDVFKDDGKKLTDGLKGQLPANTEAYSGLGASQDAVVTVDLGANPSAHNTYRVFTAINENWAVRTPASVKVSVSSDGTNYEEIATTSVYWSVAKEGDWTSQVMYVQSDSNRTERYVKFTLSPNGHVWLDEVEVCGGTALDLEGAYITAVDKRIASGECNVFTPAFGECNVSTVNYLYGYSLILKWSSTDNAYKVTYSGYGTAIESVRGETFTLESDELLVVAHDWESGISADAVYGSGTNYAAVKRAAVGDLVYICGIDVASSSCAAASYINIEYTNAEVLPDPEPEPTPNDNLAYQKSYTASGILTVDGTALYPDENQSSLTDGKYAQASGDYSDIEFVGFNVGADGYKTDGYASVTIDLGDVYAVDKFVAQVASMKNGNVGIYAPSEISVYVSTDNENWSKAGSVAPTDTDISNTISAVVMLDSSVSARYVQFRIVSAEGRNWMFVSELEVYEGDPIAEPDYLVGDVNNDGQIDSADYLIVKRACFGGYALAEGESKRADVDGSDNVDSADYVLVKRLAFGTY